MALYFLDSSAIVKRYFQEPGHEWIETLHDPAQGHGLYIAQATEVAMPRAELNDQTRNLVGQIAEARATLALTRYQVEPMLAQSRRALEYLHPDHLSSRTSTHWTLGVAYFLRRCPCPFPVYTVSRPNNLPIQRMS